MSEAAILEVVKKNFSDHLILGEEGGLIGDSSSDYLWCIDPLGLAHNLLTKFLRTHNSTTNSGGFILDTIKLAVLLS